MLVAVYGITAWMIRTAQTSREFREWLSSVNVMSHSVLILGTLLALTAGTLTSIAMVKYIIKN